jgi:hypothetical protein
VCWLHSLSTVVLVKALFHTSNAAAAPTVCHNHVLWASVHTSASGVDYEQPDHTHTQWPQQCDGPGRCRKPGRPRKQAAAAKSAAKPAASKSKSKVKPPAAKHAAEPAATESAGAGGGQGPARVAHGQPRTHRRQRPPAARRSYNHVSRVQRSGTARLRVERLSRARLRRRHTRMRTDFTSSPLTEQ